MPRKIPNYQLALFDIYSEGSLPLLIMGFQNSYKKMSWKFLENEKIGLHFIETFFFSFSYSIIRCLWKRYDMEATYWEAQCPPLLKTTHIVDMGNGEEGGPWILIEGIMHYVMNTIVSFATVNEWMFLKHHWKYTIYRTHQNLYNNGHYDYIFKCKRTFYQNLGGLHRDADCFWDSHTSESEPGALCLPCPHSRPV